MKYFKSLDLLYNFKMKFKKTYKLKLFRYFVLTEEHLMIEPMKVINTEILINRENVEYTEHNL